MPKKPIDPAVSAAASAMGKVGGKSGTGAKKRRPTSHYLEMVRKKQDKKFKRLLGDGEK